uniref:Transposase Tc1-like domain-containing protein n=1 Tax=Haplochromis burtoni TaxID=8153 RepID=A0A3Q2W121_HAPBU
MCPQVQLQKPSSAMMKLANMRTVPGKEDQESPPLLWINSSASQASETTAPQMRAQINASSRHISTSTVQRRLHESGLCSKNAAKKPLLRKSNNRYLSVKAKLSIYRSIYASTLTYGHELWVVTERTTSRLQAAEMGFLPRMAGLSLRDRVRTQSLEMPALSITLEYYTPQEMVGFKKTNHRVKKTWKKEKKSIADDLHLNDTCSSDFGSRTRGRGLKQENDEDQEVKKEEKVVMHEIHLLSGDIRMTEMDISDNEEFTPPEHAVIEEDEAEQELQKQRNLKQMQLLKDSGEKVEQHFFFNATSEFCRILGDIPTYIMDFEQEEEKDDAGVHLDHEQNQPDFATACATILDEEPIVNSGLVAALLLCKNKGLLDTQVQKVARVKCIEDKMGFDDKYSRREEYRGFMQDFKEDGCKPDVKIEYVEESGRKLTPKEGSGKMKTERRMKKLEVEALLKKMSSSDTTLGTVALLQERQKSQKTPSIVLGNSMNANTITK